VSGGQATAFADRHAFANDTLNFVPQKPNTIASARDRNPVDG